MALQRRLWQLCDASLQGWSGRVAVPHALVALRWCWQVLACRCCGVQPQLALQRRL